VGFLALNIMNMEEYEETKKLELSPIKSLTVATKKVTSRE
jgi:hypothetical protein